jgi:hypothetical protein
MVAEQVGEAEEMSELKLLGFGMTIRHEGKTEDKESSHFSGLIGCWCHSLIQEERT